MSNMLSHLRLLLEGYDYNGAFRSSDAKAAIGKRNLSKET